MTAKHANLLGWLLLALVITTGGLLLPLPYTLVSAVGIIASAVLSVIILVRRTLRSPRPMMIGAVSGFIIAGFSSFILASQVMFWGPSQEFEQCTMSALTESALIKCQEEFSSSLGR